MFTVSAIKYDKVSGASLSILREWHYSQLEWHYSQLEWHYSQLRFQNNPLPGCWEDSQPLQTYQNQLGHPNNAVNPIRNHPPTEVYFWVCSSIGTMRYHSKHRKQQKEQRNQLGSSFKS